MWMFHLHYLTCFIPAPIRLKPVHKVEGMTNGTASGAGQQQQQQQGSGQVDISTQVQQYQQFLGEFSEQWTNTYSCDTDGDNTIYVQHNIQYYSQSILITLWTLCDFSLSIKCSCVPDASRALPEFPDIDLQGKSLPEGIELEHIKSFQLLYREHCEVTDWHWSADWQPWCTDEVAFSI